MKPFLLITGMHRSGTSFLARTLNLAGVYLGDLESLITHDWNPHKSNKRGHWENQSLLTLGEKTLSISGGTWYDIPPQIKINQQIARGIKKTANQLGNNSLLAAGYKDPRILLYLDAWKKYLPKKIIMVGIFRHPLIVAESLKIRSGFDYEKSINLWKIYNQNLLKYLEKYDGFLINFDWNKRKLFSEIRLILEKMNLFTGINLEEWYTKDLINSDKSNTNISLSKDVLMIYNKLKKRSKNNFKVKIPLSLSNSESKIVIERLLTQLQKQGQYFKNLNDKNLKELDILR